MINKMTQKLKELHSNLGCPETILTSVANVAIIGLADDADDAAITARANDKSIVDMLKAFQSHVDTVRTAAKKAKHGKTTVDEPDDEPDNDDKTPKYIKDMMELIKNQGEMIKNQGERIGAMENAKKTENFDSLVTRIAKDLGIDDAVLDLVKPGLSSDMSETAIKDKLGAAKKTLSERGATFTEQLKTQVSEAEIEAKRNDALKWVKEHEVKSE